MREFLLPDDMAQIPRQGYRGSYAVVDIGLSEEGTIGHIYAIKVINGEERDNFFGEASDDDLESGRELIRRFRDFAGYLPIVGHEIDEEIVPVLEEDYGVMLGMPFSNHVIDTQDMAVNHLPHVRDYSLDGVSRALGIEGVADTEAETRCRKTWKLYCRMERSELKKRTETINPETDDPGGDRSA